MTEPKSKEDIDDDTTAFQFELDIFPESFDDFEILKREIEDTAYEFTLKMEERIHADQLGDVVYDEEHLREVFDDDEVDYAQMELIVEITSEEYGEEIRMMNEFEEEYL